MKILIVHNFYKIRAGENSVLNNEIKLLKDNGHNVITFYKDNNNIKSLYSKFYHFMNLVYSKKVYDEFVNVIKKNKPDIIHVHNFFPQITPSIFYAAKKHNIPIINTLHNYRLICPSVTLMHRNKIYEKSLTNSPYSTIIDKVYRNSYFGTFALARMISYHKKHHTWNKKVDKFIALTNFSKSKFVESGFGMNQITIKPNFVFDIFDPNSNNKKYALFVGRISEEKGVKYLIEAWNKIDYKLVLAGSGPLEDYVKSKVNDNIIFLGKQNKEEIKKLMNKASFLIIPSIWYEGFPMVILEAYSAALPVLGSKIGSIKEVILNKITGLHFNPNDSVDIIKKVENLIGDNDLLNQLSKNAREEYLKKYTPEKNYNILIDIYKDTILNEKNNHG